MAYGRFFQESRRTKQKGGKLPARVIRRMIEEQEKLRRELNDLERSLGFKRK